MYRYKASSLVVLGDPLGDENAFDELLEAFYNYAEYLAMMLYSIKLQVNTCLYIIISVTNFSN